MDAQFPDLRRRWWGLSVLFMTLIIHLVIYRSQSGTGDSLKFGLLALGFVGAALVVWGFTFWLSPSRLDWIRRWFGHGQGPFVLLGFGVMFVFGLEMRPEWFYAHAALILAAALSLTYWTFFDNRQFYARARLVGVGLLVVVVAGVIGVRAWSLSVSPSLHLIDEPWDYSWAYSYAKTGELSNCMFLGQVNCEGETYYWISRYYVFYAWWFDLVGFGFWQGRLFTLGLVLLTTVVGALAARAWYDTPTALITGIALLASAGLLAGARIRHDIGLALALSVALWLAGIGAKRGQPIFDAAAGLAIGLGLAAHYHAAGFGVVMVLALYGPRTVARWRRGIRRPDAGMIAFTLGGMVGGLAVAAVQIFPDWESFSSSREPRTPQSVAGYIETVRGHLNSMASFSRYELVLGVVALGAALRRRRAADDSLALLAVLLLLALAFMARIPFDHLIVPLMPVCGLLIGALFAHGWKHCTQEQERGVLHEINNPMMLGIALFFLLPQLAMTMQIPLRHVLDNGPLNPGEPNVTQWVKANVPAGATVIGEPYHIFWLVEDYDFAIYDMQGHLSPSERAKYDTYEDLLDAMEVDVFLYDPGVSTCCMLDRLIASGYLEERGYTVAATFPFGARSQMVYWRNGPSTD